MLQNINCLPDKVSKNASDNAKNSNINQDDIDNENEEFINAANMAFNSPNPNFIVLDRELLENFNTVNDSASLVVSNRKDSIKNSSSLDTSKTENASKIEENVKTDVDQSKEKSSKSEEVKDGESDA